MGNEVHHDQTLYKSATISRLTGYSPLVIRAWERRHKLLQPQRAPSGHRLYTEDDLRVLLRARELIGQGFTIGEVAAQGREALLHDDAQKPVASPEDMVSKLVRASVVLDQRSVNTLLDEGFRQYDEQQMIAHVLEPALFKIGVLWEAGRVSVASENVLSQAVRLKLKQHLLARDVSSFDAPDLILCATVEDEQHDLGSYVVAVNLVRAGHPVLVLGPRIPLPDLDTACHLRAPLAVCLSFKLLETFEPERDGLDALAAGHPKILFVVGGDGVPPDARSGAGNLVFYRDSDLRGLLELIREHMKRRR